MFIRWNNNRDVKVQLHDSNVSGNSLPDVERHYPSSGESKEVKLKRESNLKLRSEIQSRSKRDSN